MFKLYVFFLLPGFGEKNLTIFLSVIKLLTAIVKKNKKTK